MTNIHNSAIKASKQRLETNRSSLHLWKTHARLERIRGKNAEASKIYTMAIALEPQSPEMSPLLADAVEFYWLKGDQNEANQILSRFLDIQGPFTGLNLLRARKNLDGKASLHSIDTLQWEALTRTRFFLELSATTIQETMPIIDACISTLDRQSPLRESLTMWLCTTIFSISQIPGSMVPPAIVSERVDAALVDYDRNTILLGLFLECERGLGIWGRVRNLLDGHSSVGSMTLTSRGLRRIAWEIWAEDWGYGRWEPERVRMKFERALTAKR
jgi:tetratricopeptide (TPR) repeat protein